MSRRVCFLFFSFFFFSFLLVSLSLASACALLSISLFLFCFFFPTCERASPRLDATKSSAGKERKLFRGCAAERETFFSDLEKTEMKIKKKQVLSEGDVLFGLAVALRRGDPASPSGGMMQEQQQQLLQQQQPAAYQYQRQPGGGEGGAGQQQPFQQQPFAQAAGGR